MHEIILLLLFITMKFLKIILLTTENIEHAMYSQEISEKYLPVFWIYELLFITFVVNY